MKRKLQIILGVLFLAISLVSCNYGLNEEKQKETAELKKLHKENLEKSPFTEQLKLSKKERKANGLPPNKYYEQMWELTMNPALGRPTPNVVLELQNELLEERQNDLLSGRVPGDAMDNGWLERGPNNVGGRTRAVMFDPNDPTNETAFAGGVSGGLWKNTKISDPATEWTLVGIPENLAVSSITVDPNDSMTFYVGTGESLINGAVGGNVNGNGLWKSTNGGVSWTNVFGGITGTSYFVSASNITVNSPASIAGNYESVANDHVNNFGVEILGSITADFVLANDATGVPTEGCTDFGPDATGKIALVRRGDCPFVDKVKNAQNNGAIGVIIMNNVDGGPVSMGGTDATITIPSVMISKAAGDLIEAAMASGTVNGSLNEATGTITGLIVPGIQHINDVNVRDNGGVSEIYVAAAGDSTPDVNGNEYYGAFTYGLYKSVDGGANWTELSLPLTSDGNKHEPNDIEIGADGTIWMSTKGNIFGDGGGKVFKSTDGTTFTEAYAITDGYRTQIAVSATDPGKIYVLSAIPVEITASNPTGWSTSIKRTTTGFVPIFSTANLASPIDPSSYVAASDFTNGQGWYDLALEVDPENDSRVFIGGINNFRSTNSGGAWTKISYAYIPNGTSSVHADQHISAFGHGGGGQSSKMLFGNDGGVYYSSDGGATIGVRNNGYNTGQFYTAAVGPTAAFTGDYFAGGLQDNANQLFENANPTGTDSSFDPFNGGDGAYTFFDQDGTDQYFIGNYVYNQIITLYNFAGTNVTLDNDTNDDSNGSFINPQALDSNLDILYSNYSSGTDAIIRRYSGIKSAGTLTRTNLTDPLLLFAPSALTVSPYTTSSSTLLVGDRLGSVLLAENADGATPTWTALDSNLLPGSVSDVEFGKDEDEIFVTMHNYGVNNVWYTSDQGANWEEKDGNLPDLPVKAILQNPLNFEQVIIGTELGVWYTENFSASSPTWTQAYNGMSNVKVLDLDLRDDNMVFAATHGRGVFSGMFTAESLSVDENELSSGINMYPTVSNGEFTVKAMQNFGNTSLNVFNINGQKVYSSELELSNNTQQVNLNLASGMYLAQFTIDNTSVTKKIIIK